MELFSGLANHACFETGTLQVHKMVCGDGVDIWTSFFISNASRLVKPASISGMFFHTHTLNST